jgi:hypothetical protein
VSISRSTLATLLIAGTAIGGSAVAMVISNSPVSADQQNQLQVIAPNNSGSVQKIVSGGKVTTIQPGAVKSSVTSPAPTPTSTPSSPATPPPSFGGGSKGGDDGEDGDANDSGSGQHNFGNDDEGNDDGSDD